MKRLFACLVGAVALLALPSFARAQPGSRIERLAAPELALLRPLAARGAAAVVSNPDAGPASRVSVIIPVAAPLAAVRRALLEAERWPEYMPSLRRVELLSRRGRRAAFRFEVAASLLDVSATTSLVDVSERRIDFTVQESDFGVAASRWDLLDDGPGRTLLLLTSWSDPSQGHWLLRQASRSNATGIAGINLAVDLVLGLSVARRAVDLSASDTPVRPQRASPPTPSLDSPPAVGAWCSMVTDPHRYYVYSLAIEPDGAVSQVTVMHQTWGRADVLQQRLDDVSGYRTMLPGVRRADVIGDGGGDTVRANLSLDSPFDSGGGVLARSHPVPGATLLDGTSGALLGSRWRWDITRDPTYGNIVVFSGSVSDATASTMVRAAAGREPYLHAGLAAMRSLVWLRYMLAGLPFA